VAFESTIERCNRVLKKRWHCLKALLKHSKEKVFHFGTLFSVAKIAHICVVNMCRKC